MTTSYSFRSSVLESEKTYCLTEDGITIAVDGTTTDLIPYQELRSMNLQFNGRFNDLSRYRCVVRTANRKLALTNGHYVSLGNFESRDAEYNRFIDELHLRLHPFADQIQCTQGTMTMFVSALLFLIVMPPLVAIAMYLVVMKEARLSFTARSSLFAMPALLAVVAIPVLRKGRPRTYDIKTLPTDYLPDAA